MDGLMKCESLNARLVLRESNPCRWYTGIEIVYQTFLKGNKLNNNYMSKRKTSSLITIDFPRGLFLVFLVLKLTHVIDWSWWWVTAPLWFGAVLALAAVILVKILEIAYKAGQQSAEEQKTAPTHTSKFMQKLKEAQEASEAKRNSGLN